VVDDPASAPTEVPPVSADSGRPAEPDPATESAPAPAETAPAAAPAETGPAETTPAETVPAEGSEETGQAAGPAVPDWPELPPGYVWAYPAPEPPKWKTPRWLIALIIVWALVLAVSGTIYALHGKPTVREQTTVASAQPTIDRAITNVVAAAGSGPVVVVSPFVKTQTCKITPVRSGVEYVRSVSLIAAPGTESALLKTIADGLPASYGAKSGPGNVLNLYADAGDYVGLVGAVPAPGEIEVKAESGCRDEGPKPTEPAAPSLDSAEMAPVRTVLTGLGASTGMTTTSAAEVPCLDGRGQLRTVSVQIPPGLVTVPLNTALANLVPHPITSSANLVAYRSGSVDVVVAKDSSGTTISSTQRCSG
jgi:hypothetical protein